MRPPRPLAAALALAAVLAAPAPAAALKPTAGVRVISCSPWQEGQGGTATFAARMRATAATRRMALRIRLLERIGNGEWQRVSAEGLGVWRKSRRGVSAFRYEQHVRGLMHGASYRAAVSYRWYDAAGRVIHRARRVSAACRQPGGLPNLRIRAVKVRAGDVEGTSVYRVAVVNRGTATARRVRVLLRVDGEVVNTEVIEVLKPGERRAVKFTGPTCRSRLKAIVDPRDAIVESREDDNERWVSCL